MKVTPENREELLGQRPKGIIRYVPATISITKLLQRLENARGLHLFAFAEEIDTVTKTFKRGFSSYGDLLRVAFDNGLNTPMNRKRTMAFARWVANQMLTQHLLRFEIDGTGSNVNHWEEVFAQLPNEFNREDVQKLLKANGVNTPLRMVLYKWRLLGCIVPMEQEGGQKILRFKKAA